MTPNVVTHIQRELNAWLLSHLSRFYLILPKFPSDMSSSDLRGHEAHKGCTDTHVDEASWVLLMLLICLSWRTALRQPFTVVAGETALPEDPS